MSESAGEQPTSEAAQKPGLRNRGVKQGLPADSLKVAEESADKLWEAARKGTASKAEFARAIGLRSVTSSSLSIRLALLRGFGIIKVTGDRVGLSELGLDLVQGFEPELKAASRRKAVVYHKTYRGLVDNFEGTVLPTKDRIALKFKYEFGKSDDMSVRAADAFVESLSHAEMIDANGMVRRDELAEGSGDASESTAGDDNWAMEKPETEAFEDVMDPDADADGEVVDDVFEQADEATNEADGVAANSITQDVAPAVAKHLNLARQPGTDLTLEIRLDLSSFRADEVIQILRAIGIAQN